MGTPTIIPISFPSRTGISNVVDISAATAVVGLIMPAAWTPAIITIEASVDGTNFYVMYEGRNSTRLSFTVPPGTIVALDPNRMRCCKALRLISGDRVNLILQAAARDFGLVVET